MPPSDSNSAARLDLARGTAPVPRDRLFPPTTVLALAAAVAGALALIFPRSQELSAIAAQARTNELSLQYLRNLVRASPTDSELQWLLAEQELSLGHYHVARGIVGAAREHADRTEHRRADLLLLRAAIAERDRTDPGRRTVARDQALRQEIRQLLDRLLAPGEWSYESLDLLLREILRDPAGESLLDQLYQRLERDRRASAEDCERVGQRLLAVGQPRQAARFLLLAEQRAASPAERRRLLLAGLQALQAANAYSELAQVLAQPLERFGDDQALWQQLTRMALAVGRPDLAERFIKRALRMALLRRYQAERLQFAALGGPVSGGQLVKVATGEPAATFDDALYLLGYQVFLANRNLDDAYLLARAAVQARPDDRAWRTRLAQVTRWLNRPDESLRHWLDAARLGEPTAWEEIRVLSVQTLDPVLKREALETLLRSGHASGEALDQLVAAYDANGQPEQAIQLLRQQYGKQREKKLLDRLAQYQRWIGDISGAEETYRLEWKDFGLDPVLAQKLAQVLLQTRRPEAAFEVLDSLARDTGQTPPPPFWKFYGELALMLQRPEAARHGYRQALAVEEPALADLLAYYSLSRESDPTEARRAAWLGWQRHRHPVLLLGWLELGQAAGDWSELERFFASQTTEAQTLMAQQPRYWLIRAQTALQGGRLRQARDDYRTALRLDPGNNGLRAGYLWMMVDSRNLSELNQLVENWREAARHDRQLGQAMGAALLALGRPMEARDYYRAELRRMRAARQEPDRLWLTTYAEILTQANQPESAKRVRQALWQQLRQAARDNPQRFLRTPDELERLAQLALSESAGDAQSAIFRTLLRERSQDENEAVARAELLLNWQLVQEKFDPAHYAMWLRQARGLSTPAYLSMLTALNRDDTEQIGQLLLRQQDAVSVYDRVYAARALGRLGEERAWVAAALTARPDDEILQQQFQEAFWRRTGRLALAAESNRRGPLESGSHRIELLFPYSAHGRLELAVRDERQRNRDPLALGAVPVRDRRYALAFGHGGASYQWRLEAERREARERFGSLLLEANWQAQRDLGLRLALGQRRPADDSVALRVAGRRDHGSLGLDLRLGRREYLRVDYQDSRFETQSGRPLGRGRQLTWEAGYRLRLDPPDLGIRLSGSDARYRHDGEVPPGYLDLIPRRPEPQQEPEPEGRPFLPFFLPQSGRQYQLSVGFNETESTGYRRALTAFGSAGLVYHERSGAGYEARLGISGSLFGAMPNGVDRLSFYLLQSRGARAGSRDLTRQIGLQWQYWFDKPALR
ncbi:tetratricopeptide repeat protein [Chitinimonas lacunae]|uniref:Tetratricopeptide repeat protein n=1 Tax=Chitinimonas lacunae TaxID=1963018 RepID=A0ABV8ML25_9NEIS